MMLLQALNVLARSLLNDIDSALECPEMLRITEMSENRNGVRLRLDGSITDRTVEELVAACTRIQNSNKTTIILDMAGVDFMSNDAAQKLITMRDDRVRIINCTPFIDILLGDPSEINQRS